MLFKSEEAVAHQGLFQRYRLHQAKALEPIFSFHARLLPSLMLRDPVWYYQLLWS